MGKSLATDSLEVSVPLVGTDIPVPPPLQRERHHPQLLTWAVL